MEALELQIGVRRMRNSVARADHDQAEIQGRIPGDAVRKPERWTSVDEVQLS